MNVVEMCRKWNKVCIPSSTCGSYLNTGKCSNRFLLGTYPDESYVGEYWNPYFFPYY